MTEMNEMTNFRASFPEITRRLTQDAHDRGERAMREACSRVLDVPEDTLPRTQSERRTFERAWDLRVQKGQHRDVLAGRTTRRRGSPVAMDEET